MHARKSVSITVCPPRGGTSPTPTGNGASAFAHRWSRDLRPQQPKRERANSIATVDFTSHYRLVEIIPLTIDTVSR